MSLLVIIVSYNFERWLDKCLGSLRASLQPVDVLVVDNGSQDNTVARIERDYPEVRLVKNGRNIGFGQANNIGLRIAVEEGYDAVFLQNQDSEIEPETIGVLYRHLHTLPDCGILSPVHLTGDGKGIDEAFEQYTAFQECRSQAPVIPATFINAAFWMISTDVIRRVGEFSPRFHMYGEDKDYVNRLHHAGYCIAYCQESFARHDRQDRRPTRDFFFRKEEAYLLSELTNPVYSRPRAFAYSVLAAVKKSLIALLHGKGSNALRYLSIARRLTLQL
ncbi:MAG: glycosyltransferase family 2 protein [Bacteroides sp.]|nr:glycosyltransferase family 2 protein [Bacteroides sp.]